MCIPSFIQIRSAGTDMYVNKQTQYLGKYYASEAVGGY